MNDTSIHTGLDLLKPGSAEIMQLRGPDQAELNRPLGGVTVAGGLWHRGETLLRRSSQGYGQRFHASRWSVVLSDRSTRKTMATLSAVLLALTAAFFGAAIVEGGLTGVALILLWSANIAGLVLACFITHRLLMASILYRAGKTYDRAVEAFESRLRSLE